MPATEDPAARNLEHVTARAQALVDGSSLAIVIADCAGRVVSWNSKSERLLDLSEEDLLGRPLPVIPAGSPTEFNRLFRRLLRGERPQEFEVERKGPEGRSIIIGVSAGPMRDSAGGICGVMAVLIDLGERRRSERTRRRLADVLETTPDLVGISTVGGEIVYINAAGQDLLGVTCDEQISHLRLWDHFVEPHQAVIRDLAIPEAIRDGSWSGEVTLRTTHDRRIPTSLLIVAHRNIDSTVDHFSWIARDISERKALEEHARQAQTLDAMSRLAGGIAHDFNNLLTSIIGNADLLLTTLVDEQRRTDAMEIKNAGQRAANLTKQLLAFSRQRVNQPQPVDLNAVLGQAAMRLKRLIGDKIELVTLLDGALADIRSDPTQIEEIVAGVVENACEAMPRGGRLTIETADTQVTIEEARKLGLPVPGRYSVLSVSDNGLGMDEEIRARIFEPFFSTKTIKGAGLGLTAAYGIARQSGGRITVESTPGQGTTVRLYFPALESDIDVKQTATAIDTIAHPEGATVLVAEDEPAVLSLAARVLRNQGFTVLEARDGADALRVQAEHLGSIELLITDVVMPKLGGPELAERLLQVRPATRVVFMSGYADNPTVRRLLEDGKTIFLQKPFTPRFLATIARQALD